MVKVKLKRTALEVAMSRKNITQRDLALKIGFSRSHLSHIISGRRERTSRRPGTITLCIGGLVIVVAPGCEVDSAAGIRIATS